MIFWQKRRNWLRCTCGTGILCAALWLFSPVSARAATASPIAVNSTSVVGNTVTVTTATAHGLAVNQGFCNQTFTTPYCGVVVSTPTGTTFTFTQNGASACASSCGTIVPAKRVIWLATSSAAGGYEVNYLLWLTTQAPVARTGAVSAWPNVSTAENAAIAAGAFIEVARSAFFPLNTTLANAEAQLANDYAAQQSQLASSVQPGQFFGNFYDGTGWLQ